MLSTRGILFDPHDNPELDCSHRHFRQWENEAQPKPPSLQNGQASNPPLPTALPTALPRGIARLLLRSALPPVSFPYAPTDRQSPNPVQLTAHTYGQGH